MAAKRRLLRTAFAAALLFGAATAAGVPAAAADVPLPTEIVSGLTEGETLALPGETMFKDGELVQVANPPQ